MKCGQKQLTTEVLVDVGSSDFSWALVTVGVGRAEDADDLGIGELALIKAEVDEAAADLAAS